MTRAPPLISAGDAYNTLSINPIATLNPGYPTYDNVNKLFEVYTVHS